MRDLSALVEAATEAEEGKMFWFLELQFDTTVRYTDADVDLYINTTVSGSDYKFETMPFEIGKIGYSAKSSVDKLKIDIQNVDLTMSATLLNEDIMNKWGLVYIGFYDDDNVLISEPIKVFEGLVSTWKLTEMKASITLVNEFIFWNKKVMRKHQGTCRWAFKGTECGYSGIESWCDQSYARCETLNNRDNFGGFRFLPDLEERKIYWGKTT